jgi:hypothetical protein
MNLQTTSAEYSKITMVFEFISLSDNLKNAKNFSQFCKVLPMCLEFINKYHSEQHLINSLIELVGETETRLENL